jgi:Mg2+ and Co2+ transporter CorA
MTIAMKDVILMVRTGETSESVNYAAVGPRYIVIVPYKNLLTRKLMKEMGFVDFYRKRTLKLVRLLKLHNDMEWEANQSLFQQYDVYHKPARRRVLGEIQRLHEELSAALAMRFSQWDAVSSIGKIGSAESYRISNQFRNQQYHLETDVGQDCVTKLALETEELQQVLQRLATLKQKVRYRIEVLEEDNSKAIFIFTVVAAIFLPLSSVTSYLGKNITNIRGMNNSRSTFWAVAVPVTVFVVALAVLAAYKGDTAREWLYERRNLFARPALASGRPKAGDGRLKESQSTKKRVRVYKSMCNNSEKQDVI